MQQKEKTFYQNPDFDEIFFFYDEEVSSSRDAFKQVEGTEYFAKVVKLNSQYFISRVKEKLLKKKKKKWPYTTPLMLSVGVSGIKKIYGQKDLDNILKSVFDAFKGIVFLDDDQIHLVIASKQIWEHTMKGFFVGLRVLPPAPRIDRYVPALFSQNKESWGPDWDNKFLKDDGEEFSSFEVY